jgi:hypothetical protein
LKITETEGGISLFLIFLLDTIFFTFLFGNIKKTTTFASDLLNKFTVREKYGVDEMHI